MEKKRTSKKQFQIYNNFIKENPVLISGKLHPTCSSESLEGLWAKLTQILNSCGDGPIREAASWKKVFTEWKSACRKKARESKPLSNLEEDLLNLTGRGAISGLDVQELGIQSGPSQVKYLENIVDADLDVAIKPKEELLLTPQVHKEEIRKTKSKKKGTKDALCETYEAATTKTGEKLEEISLAILEVAKAINRYYDIVEASNMTTEYVDAEEAAQEDVAEVENNNY